MRRIKSEKGITLIELTITIAVLLVLAGITTTLGISSILELRNFNAVKSDIIALTEAVQTYYLENEKLPLEDETLRIDFTPPEDNKNPNDSGEYYEIDATLLEGVTLQRKRRTYLVDKQSLTVYCKEGVEYQGKTYYTILDNNDTSDYYNQINLPIISTVIFESNNNINKYWATSGDTVTLKFFTNYEINPTVTINGTATTVTWNSDKRIGTAKYEIPSNIPNPDEEVPFSISNYSANGKTGETITKPTFSDRVIFKVNTWQTMKVDLNTEATGNGTINGGTPNTNNPIIPRGYTPINAGKATWGDGSSSPAQSSVDNGLVIKDSKGNEWVWVPVEESVLSGMYVTSNDGIALSGDVGVTTKMYTKTTTIGKTGDTKTLSRSTPNTTGWREPDLVTDYDKNESYYKTILGFDSPKAMAEAFTIDYANMITSIQKYGGFYIGRYELSNEGVQKGKATLTNTNWYELYKKCTTLNASGKVESKMIWGIQWDLACDFISKKGEQKSITDSRKWGNYSDSTDPANTGNYEQDTAGHAIKKNTGSNEAWKANNIYDIAGNCWEWTQEAADTFNRASRGGSHGYGGSSRPASFRYTDYADYSIYSNLRFSSHFNNKVGVFNFNCVKLKV